MNKRFSISALSLALALCAAGPTQAQVAGASTALGISVTESTQIAMGWSVKKSLMGKTIYNEQGQKVGKVEDLIISPDKSVSYIIVGAGGFVGIGRHDVAIAIEQIQDRAGKLIIPGATKDTIKALPSFEYADDSSRRAHFVAEAEKDIASGKTRLSDLEKKAGTAATEAKAKLDIQIASLQTDVKFAESKLGELKDATAKRWREFEAGVNAATARLRKSLENTAV